MVAGGNAVSIYKRFGVRPLINAAGTKTRLGGAHMPPEVLEAMTEAAQEAVDMADLQAAASRVIAHVTGAEAGYVTSGAAAALTLGAAACITGLDPAKIDRLPDTGTLPSEILIFRSHRNSYDHGWRAAGARLVEIGMDDRTAGSGVRLLEPWEIEAAVSERTVALAYVANLRNEPPLEPLIEAAHAHGIPVLVDAAGRLPPEENLRYFIEAGADLVAFSGGKAIGGPQSTGVLCGKKHLIQAVLLNHLDMDMDLDLWDPPEDLLPRAVLKALPHHGIGRGFKVSRENIVALLVALERFASGAWREELAERREIANAVMRVAEKHSDVAGHLVDSGGYPRVRLTFADAATARQIYRQLLEGEPGIAFDPSDVYSGVLIVDTTTLRPEETPIIVERLQAILSN
jgi:L-seryl-tRNA(Ser) seleniumtransferase